MTKFYKEVKDKIIYAVSIGCSYQLACDYAGVSYSAFKHWMKEARRQEEIPEEEKNEFWTFFTDIKKASGNHALYCLEKISKAAEEGEWTAAAWKLERIHAKYYSKDALYHELREEMNRLREQIMHRQGGDNETEKSIEDNIDEV